MSDTGRVFDDQQRQIRELHEHVATLAAENRALRAELEAARKAQQ